MGGTAPVRGSRPDADFRRPYSGAGVSLAGVGNRPSSRTAGFQISMVPYSLVANLRERLALVLFSSMAPAAARWGYTRSATVSSASTRPYRQRHSSDCLSSRLGGRRASGQAAGNGCRFISWKSAPVPFVLLFLWPSLGHLSGCLRNYEMGRHLYIYAVVLVLARVSCCFTPADLISAGCRRKTEARALLETARYFRLIDNSNHPPARWRVRQQHVDCPHSAGCRDHHLQHRLARGRIPYERGFAHIPN